jgi:hypothetical protein
MTVVFCTDPEAGYRKPLQKFCGGYKTFVHEEHEDDWPT